MDHASPRILPQLIASAVSGSRDVACIEWETGHEGEAVSEQANDTWWVFDRPLLRDGLFWSGLVVGLILAIAGAASASFDRSALPGQVVQLAVRGLFGVGLVGVVGGSARNFWRGLRGT